MNITDIKIRRLYNEGVLLALVSITIDNEIAIHDIKIIQGKERKFVAMPSRRDSNGNFHDSVHPISMQARQLLEKSILEAYQSYVKMFYDESQL